jgi:hypothetical protein
VAAWITLDLIASYTFNLPPPAAAEVPGLAKDGGKNVKMKALVESLPIEWGDVADLDRLTLLRK